MSEKVVAEQREYYVPPIINKKGNKMTEETKKELARYKRYSAALEKEVKSLRNALDQIRITLEAKKDGIVPTRFNLDSVDGYVMFLTVKKALEAK